MTNGVNPRDRMLTVLSKKAPAPHIPKRKTLVRVKKNVTTHMHEQNCEITVARLEPRTPIPKVKIKIGSSTIFTTAPSRTEPIAINERPCVSINGLSPCKIIRKSVPQEYIFRYETANSTAPGGQPKQMTIGFAKMKTAVPSTMPIPRRSRNAVLKMPFASFSLPSPNLMPARGAPPSPIRFANA